MADFTALDELRSVEELNARLAEVRASILRIDEEARGLPFNDEQREEYGALDSEEREIVKRVAELDARARRVAELSGSPRNVERFTFNTPRPGATSSENIYDMSALRGLSADQYESKIRDNAKRSIATSAFPDADAPGKVERLVDNDMSGEVAQRILTTGSPTYKRAFGKMLVGREHSLTNEERTSMSLTAGNGGYAVPYTLDPTVVLTSDGSINPVRQIARVITITGNTWNGVSSAGVTASYDAELTEVSDDSPTFTQPTANVEKAQAFVAYSIEIGEDWGALSAEMARLFADAKDTLENTMFHSGLGHSSVQPEGLLVGATGTVLTASASVMAVADIYSLVEALAPRWRARGTFAGSLAAFNKVRQFDSSGGASLWVQLGDGMPARLLGKPDFEWSAYSGAITTGNASVLTFGDFNEFSIIDRVGMNVEFVPHIFATANNRPAGQRGLYAYWRNTSDVRTAAAFKTLKIKP